MRRLPSPFVRCAASAIAAFALFVACSGGSSRSSLPDVRGGAASSLFIDGAAGLDTEVAGRLAAVVLEAVDGSSSGDLLAVESAVALARADGGGSLLALRGVPRGAFAALLLRFADDSLRARLPDGSEVPLAAGVHAMRIPFASPWLVDGAPARLALRHRAPLALVAGPGGTWSLDAKVEVAPVDVIPIRFGQVEVLGVDRRTQRVSGLLSSSDHRPVELRFAPDALLLREPAPDPLDLAAFLDGLESGARLLVDGLLDFDDQMVVTAAVDLGLADPNGQGNRGELRGRIMELLPGRTAVRVALLEVRKGAGLLPDPVPRTLVVGAARARIKWVPRRGRHHAHLPYAALEEGMIVAVSWHGAVTGRELLAEKIDIHAQGVCFERAFAGEVVGISLAPRRLTLRLPEAVVIEGRELRELEIDVGEDVPIVRSSGGSMRLVEFGAIERGETARVLIDARGRGRFRASLILLEWR